MQPLITNGKYNYNAMCAIADRHAARCRAEADKLCREAGLGAFCGCSLHNALLDAGTRNGWGKQITDYSKLRRARWLMDTHAFKPGRLIDALYARRGHTSFNWS